jgi:hypothetical protein
MPGPEPSRAQRRNPLHSRHREQHLRRQHRAADLGSRVQKLEESTQLLGSKIDEQYQTKVETAAKYRARLSGIVLMNAFRNVGASDNLDFPNYAQPPARAHLRLALALPCGKPRLAWKSSGPTLAGAKTSANVQFDFAGGFPATPNGVNFGIARMQTASLRLDWKDTSVIAGQDSLFISPLSPTSFASLAIPAFAYAGNLWGWTPQLRIEHRFDLPNEQTLTCRVGFWTIWIGKLPTIRSTAMRKLANNQVNRHTRCAPRGPGRCSSIP